MNGCLIPLIYPLCSDKYMVMEERTSEYSTRMQLQIRDFQASDVGVYTCISTNSLGKSDGTIRFYGECKQWIQSLSGIV